MLEALGVKIDLNAEQVESCLKEVGIGFMFAPAFHPAMKYAGPPRREIGIRTVFNILGPLTNPAHAQAQVLGRGGIVADGEDGRGASHCWDVATHWWFTARTAWTKSPLPARPKSANSKATASRCTRSVRRTSVSPESAWTASEGGSPADNAAMVRRVLSGTTGPQRDVVLMNAAAAIVAGDKAKNLQEGARLAAEAIDSGRALQKLDQLVKFSQSVGVG